MPNIENPAPLTGGNRVIRDAEPQESLSTDYATPSVLALQAAFVAERFRLCPSTALTIAEHCFAGGRPCDL